jgi:DNA-binding HxlR family transcriptional regulator
MAFSVERIDDVIHGRMRLGIMAYLVRNEVADFNELKAALNATQGNLSVHLRKLEEAGYVKINKGYLGRKPRTRIQLLQKGRKAFNAYLDDMSSLIEGARQ